MSDFDKLRAANAQRDTEWSRGQKFSLSYRGNELAGEVGEACNVLKKLERELMGLNGSRATIAELKDELADVVICTDLAAMSAGINLNEAIQEKFNATSNKYGLSTKLFFEMEHSNGIPQTNMPSYRELAHSLRIALDALTIAREHAFVGRPLPSNHYARLQLTQEEVHALIRKIEEPT